ncbi:MAG: bifunctional 5,10-methylenetetrahydrofolate dehydrogenase/5,10-methenyltetrahydrofolate cyclohydrolase, partial [Alphaproteobacteria bacterium]|nr:bifunctional 5,10-methylenetetrahydrofolate dehydrogenase/5,10-methenyltetrahydrofolate cyclohydrolase [Alphaproteobacteria bacterium]
MTKIIDGKKLSEKILLQLKKDVDLLAVKPVLAIVLASPSASSLIYVNNKIKAAQKIGIQVELFQMNESVTHTEIESKILELNNRVDISAIIVQLPLYNHLDSYSIINKIDPTKDVDGLHSLNIGTLYSGNIPLFVPCTPLGILKILQEEFKDLAGLHVAMIGRSNIVGRPLASLLLQKDATITICHSKTRNLHDITSRADVVVCASGQSLKFGKEYFTQNSVVIDVGINRTAEGKVVGDV